LFLQYFFTTNRTGRETGNSCLQGVAGNRKDRKMPEND
jgi:hypothetical protein